MRRSRGRGVAGDGGEFYAGGLGNFVAELFEVGGAFLDGGVGVLVDGDLDGHNVVGIVAERAMGELEEALDSGSGAGHHEQGEGDLAGDENAAELAAGL